MPRLLSLVCALSTAGLLLSLGTPAARAENGLTIYGGWRASSGLEDTTTGRSLSMRETGAISVAVDIDSDESTQIQIFGSYQNTSFDVTEIGQANRTRMSLKVAYLHIGGSAFAGPASRGGAYAVGGLGITVLSPSLEGLGTETKPSINLGLGYLLPLGDSLALRFEGRGYFTLINSSGGFFCSGGCTVSINGNLLTQGEVMAGLSWRFK